MAPTEIACSNSACCKKCKQSVKNGAKCKLCSNIFHNSCAKLCSYVKFVEENVVVCCENSATTTCHLSVENLMFPDAAVYIIKLKDEIIRELRDKIILLNQHIMLMKNVCDGRIRESEEVNNVKVNATIKSTTDKALKKTVGVSTATRKHASSPDANKAEKTVITKPASLVNSDQLNQQVKNINVASTDSTKWELVTNNRKKKRVDNKPIIGSSTSSNASLKAVAKRAYVHVYRLDPTT